MEMYSSFEEKGTFFQFGEVKIDNDKDFNHYTHLLAIYHHKKDFVFRGLSESKYKLYNSAQRVWGQIASEEHVEDGDRYDAFVIDLISECKKWNISTVPNFLKTYGIHENNSVAYLGFMQHYGIPTPLLDFTKNPHKALYFAIEALPNEFVDSQNEMENYFSVYYSYENNSAFESFAHVFAKNREKKASGEFDYSDLTKNGIFLASERTEEFKVVNNIRIANQEGLFFYNNSPFKSLEEQYKGFADQMFEKFGEKKCEELLIHKTFCGCFNFHKKYVPGIKKIIEKMGITREFVYPDVNDLINHCKAIYGNHGKK
jgi:FRG domain